MIRSRPDVRVADGLVTVSDIECSDRGSELVTESTFELPPDPRTAGIAEEMLREFASAPTCLRTASCAPPHLLKFDAMGGGLVAPDQGAGHMEGRF